MNDLNTLLDRAAGPVTAHVDAHPDLTRGHRALAHRRRRRGAAGLVSVVATGVLGVVLTRGGENAADIANDPIVVPTGDPTPPTSSPTVDPSAPVTGTGAPNFFEVPPAPFGWEIQGSSPSIVTFARPGDTTIPESFQGKIVLMLTANPPSGTKRVMGGRALWVDSGKNGEYTTVSVRTRSGEPSGVLVLQFPGAALSVQNAAAFVGDVLVRDGAIANPG